MATLYPKTILALPNISTLIDSDTLFIDSGTATYSITAKELRASLYWDLTSISLPDTKIPFKGVADQQTLIGTISSAGRASTADGIVGGGLTIFSISTPAITTNDLSVRSVEFSPAITNITPNSTIDVAGTVVTGTPATPAVDVPGWNKFANAIRLTKTVADLMDVVLTVPIAPNVTSTTTYTASYIASEDAIHTSAVHVGGTNEIQTAVTVRQLGQGLIRKFISFTASATGAATLVLTIPAAQALTLNVTGFQLTVGTYVNQPYIRTTVGPVMRAADTGLDISAANISNASPVVIKMTVSSYNSTFAPFAIISGVTANPALDLHFAAGGANGISGTVVTLDPVLFNSSADLVVRILPNQMIDVWVDRVQIVLPTQSTFAPAGNTTVRIGEYNGTVHSGNINNFEIYNSSFSDDLLRRLK